MDGNHSNWLENHWPVWAAKTLWFWSRLVRTRIIGFDQTEGFTTNSFAHWHGDELALFPHFGRLGPTVLVSNSKDGEIMARAAASMGYRVTRGSSSRGAVGGLLALIRAVRSGHSAVLAVDGPRGPRSVCKPGIIRIAQKTGVPLFPVGVAASRKIVFRKAWNLAYLPLPFAREVIVFGNPVFFSGPMTHDGMEQACRLMEDALHRAQAEAEKALSNWR